MDNALFVVGQRIVAIKNSHSGRFKKGDEFTVLATGIQNCGCAVVDVGFISDKPMSGCDEHGLIITASENNGIGWVSADNFAPIQTQREKIKYVAVSETLREKAVEIAAVETN